MSDRCPARVEAARAPAEARPATTGATRRSPRQPILALQSAAGNRAVAGLLAAVQRENGDAEAAPADDRPLTGAQVNDAIRYYTSQPWRYTPAIIRQIQSAVGVAAEGRVNEETVQAVARWQDGQGSGDPPLVVDGKAGPRTLPRLFRSGLNVVEEAHGFGEAAQTGVIDRWAELTPQERAAELVRLVNVRLQAAGVPPVIPNATDTGVAAGQFDFGTWQMEVGLPALSGAQVTRDEAAEIVDTIYHEARHAEQWFRMAQMRAGRGRSAAGIISDLRGIPPHVADAAVAAPLARGTMEALIAEGWYESVYGSGAAYRERVLTEVLAARAALNQAQERFAADPTPENQAALTAAQTRFDTAFGAYRELPEENDAWATAPLTGTGVTRGSPEPAGGGEATDTEPQAPGTPGPAGAAPQGGPTGAAPQGGPTELGDLAAEMATLLGSPAAGQEAVPGRAEPQKSEAVP